ASIGSEVWTSTRFRAIGLLQPQTDGRVRFEMHTPVTMASNFIDPDELESGGEIDRLLTMFRLGPLIRTPTGSAGTELFGAVPADSLAADDTNSLRQLANRVEKISAEGEPVVIREQRLGRIEALTEVLRALSTALDIRDVFDQLSTTAR